MNKPINDRSMRRASLSYANDRRYHVTTEVYLRAASESAYGIQPLLCPISNSGGGDKLTKPGFLLKHLMAWALDNKRYLEAESSDLEAEYSK